MEKYYPYKDPQLLTFYCEGNDEVVFHWVMFRYKRKLFFIAFKSVRDPDHSREVLHTVADELVTVEEPKRESKLRLVNKRVEASLVRMAKFRAIDFFRSNSRTLYSNEEELLAVMDKNADNELVRQFEAREQINYLRKALEGKYGQEEGRILELILQNPGKLEPVAEQLNISSDEARTRKQRVMRRARRILLNAN